MILSVHVPKTAGRSFQRYLQDVFGQRLLSDYGDWAEIKTDEGIEHNEQRRLAMLAQKGDIRQNYDVIHGHFLPTKYSSIFIDRQIVMFVRDPYQHAISTYHHARRNPMDHPGLRFFREKQMTIIDLIEAWPNHQSLYLSEFAIEDLAMIGITEAYGRSVAMFQAIFGVTTLPRAQRENVNPEQQGRVYEVTDDVRRAVDRHRAEDVALYRRAVERFEMLARRHGL